MQAIKDFFPGCILLSFCPNKIHRYTLSHTSNSTRVLTCLKSPTTRKFIAWWRHQMETFSALGLLAICAENSPVPGEFPAQGPVTRSFGVFFDLRLNKRLSKQSWGWWFETLSRPLWRHRNELVQKNNKKPLESAFLAFVERNPPHGAHWYINGQ